MAEKIPLSRKLVANKIIGEDMCKKIFLSLFIGLCARAFSNPIPVAVPLISELTFDSSNRWILEIYYAGPRGYYDVQTDSIIISSKSGSSKIHIEYWNDTTKYFVITSDSLYSPLDITRSGDSICVEAYHKPPIGVSNDFFVFGHMNSSQLDTLLPGYSYSKIDPFYFYKDKSPTIGQPNDTVGMMGLVRGFIYDRYNHPVKTGNYRFSYCFTYSDITLNGDGSYSVPLLSCHFGINTLLYPPASHTYQIQQIDINMNPDSLIRKDIKILDELQGVETDNLVPVKHEISVINYPNPFNSTTNFRVKFPRAYEAADNILAIYNSAGKKVNEIIVQKSGTVTWDGRGSNGNILASGVYYYRLINKNVPVASGSMILLK